MKEIHNILTSKFPKTVDRIEGRLVFLDQHEINKVISPKLEALCKLDFYQAKFFTGYHKLQVYLINAFSILIKALPLIFTWKHFNKQTTIHATNIL